MDKEEIAAYLDSRGWKTYYKPPGAVYCHFGKRDEYTEPNGGIFPLRRITLQKTQVKVEKQGRMGWELVFSIKYKYLGIEDDKLCLKIEEDDLLKWLESIK